MKAFVVKAKLRSEGRRRARGRRVRKEGARRERGSFVTEGEERAETLEDRHCEGYCVERRSGQQGYHVGHTMWTSPEQVKSPVDRQVEPGTKNREAKPETAPFLHLESHPYP